MSSEFIVGSTVLSIILRLFALITTFFVLKHLIYIWRKYWRTHKELKNYNKKSISSQNAFELVEQFNDKSIEYIDTCCKNLEEFNSLPCQCTFMRINKLIGAFEQISRLLNITVKIINHKDLCINNPKIAGGIPVYKIRNIYNYVCEVFDIIDNEKAIINSADIKEFDKDINLAKVELKKITAFLTQA